MFITKKKKSSENKTWALEIDFFTPDEDRYIFAVTDRIKPRGSSFGFPYFNHWSHANTEQVKIY